MGEKKIVALIQESLHVAIRTGAAKPEDFTKIIVVNTVQPKAIAFPADARLAHRALETFVWLARKLKLARRADEACPRWPRSHFGFNKIVPVGSYEATT